ncbi:MAG: ATP-binding protein [Xanthomonadales bacterium]|nr:ATP-binding protein [Xanthomonadales bacterium]
MDRSGWRIFGGALPWLLALGYLALIAYLGLTFQRVDGFRVDQVYMATIDGNPQPVSLGLFRLLDGPDDARLTLPFDSSGEDLAVFFPRMSASADVYVNGQLIHQRPVSYPASFQYRPQLVPIPARVLAEGGSNELRVELQPRGNTVVLGVFYLGPRMALEPAFLAFDFFRQDLVGAAVAVAALLAVFMGTVWLVRRQFREYGWLALAFAAFTYYLYSFVGARQPLNPQLYDWSFLLARAVFVWSFLCFVHRFLELHRRWLERALGIFYLVVFGAGLVLVLTGRYWDFVSLTYVSSLPMVMLVVAYVVVVLAIALARTRQVYLHWLLVGSLLGLLLGLHDVLVLFDVQHWLVRDFYISHYAIIFITIGYGGVVVHRVAHALMTSEDLNLELNRLLEIKSAELEAAARERGRQEKRLALYAERQRIMSDMHDGVGGQLVSLIAASGSLDRGAIAGELDAILADLRLVLDALTPSGEDLVMSLARLRERYAPVLGHAGITLHMKIDRDIDAVAMSPSDTVSVMRLVQEAIQNAVKHAKCSDILVELSAEPGRLSLTVRDDGTGIADASPGHGSRTMVERAQALGGELEIRQPPGGGTEVELRLPNGDGVRQSDQG